MLYAFNENFILPFSHDEVVHGKGSMFGKMPGDDWQKAATLRALYGFMYAHPGKKLMFMGDEFGQTSEWNHDRASTGICRASRCTAACSVSFSDLNRIYAAEPALHEVDFDFSGFQWIDCNDSENSVVSFIRRAKSADDFVVAVLNFTPVPREQLPHRRAGCRHVTPRSSTATPSYYGGGNVGNGGSRRDRADRGTTATMQSINLRLPPLGFLLLKPWQSSVDSPISRRIDAADPRLRLTPTADCHWPSSRSAPTPPR